VPGISAIFNTAREILLGNAYPRGQVTACDDRTRETGNQRVDRLLSHALAVVVVKPLSSKGERILRQRRGAGPVGGGGHRRRHGELEMLDMQARGLVRQHGKHPRIRCHFQTGFGAGLRTGFGASGRTRLRDGRHAGVRGDVRGDVTPHVRLGEGPGARLGVALFALALFVGSRVPPRVQSKHRARTLDQFDCGCGRRHRTREHHAEGDRQAARTPGAGAHTASARSVHIQSSYLYWGERATVDA
jgi:hypothetical protein